MTNNLSTSTTYDLAIPGTSTFVTLHFQDLVVYGCDSCSWKHYGKCPYPDKHVDGGICEEKISFMSSLLSPGDSRSSLLEKYNIYLQQLQTQDDYQHFKRISKELSDLESDPYANPDKLKLKQFQLFQIRTHWNHMNNNVIRNLSRVVDREQKSVSDTKPKMSVQQLNILINESREKLLKYEQDQ